jgi:ubiquinone/menaquinone biosynthesis C-methylase UbiE
LGTTLTPQEAGKVYDRIGRFQDWQSFYEGPATRDLEAHAGFDSAQSVFELGCGTGAYAARMLDHLLPSEATYHGVDVSEKMVAIASGRLQRFEDRARADLVSGEPPLPGSDGSFDRFLAIYVIDLLSHDLASCLLQEAHRLLGIGGRICLVSLAQGATRTARAVCSAWNATFGLSPSLVGGCRPVDLPALLDATWRVDHVSTLTSWAVTSQIVVAHPVGEDVRVFPVVLWAGVSPETCR